MAEKGFSTWREPFFLDHKLLPTREEERKNTGELGEEIANHHTEDPQSGTHRHLLLILSMR